MRMYQLSETQMSLASDVPESAMNVQWATDGGEWYVVIGGMAALKWDDEAPDESLTGYLGQAFVQPGLGLAARETAFETWLAGLKPAPFLSFHAPGGGSSGSYSHPPLGLTPSPPATIYGHCVFTTFSASDAVFYRFEHWPISRRVNHLGSNKIITDTFASPASEVQFMPTGFSAVARCALPTLLPAVFRYELQPPANSPMACGASVPLFGQAGGGVEVKFLSSIKNRCPMADPVYIPPM